MKTTKKIENDFMYKGFRCVVVGLYLGHRCGYLGIPSSHKLYGKSLDDAGIAVHGGWTLEEYSDSFSPVDVYESVWWCGFDCGHACDCNDLDLIKELNNEKDAKLLCSVAELTQHNGIVRTTKYVEDELVDAVDQIVNMFVY